MVALGEAVANGVDDNKSQGVFCVMQVVLMFQSILQSKWQFAPLTHDLLTLTSLKPKPLFFRCHVTDCGTS